MSDITTRLWERAEAAIEKVILCGGLIEARGLAHVATVAVLRQLSDELAGAEEDGIDWPDSDDLALIADDLEEQGAS